jgi:hypothetical protein
MSIRFKEPMNDAAKEMILRVFGEPQYQDSRMSLFGRSLIARRGDLVELANVSDQAVHVVEHEEGDVVELESGEYRCTSGQGWVPYTPETWQCDCCKRDRPMISHQIIIGMKQFCCARCVEVYRMSHGRT